MFPFLGSLSLHPGAAITRDVTLLFIFIFLFMYSFRLFLGG